MIGMVYNFRMNLNNLFWLFDGEMPRTPLVEVFAVRAFAVVYVLRKRWGSFKRFRSGSSAQVGMSYDWK
jgi:hypothetical protein